MKTIYLLRKVLLICLLMVFFAGCRRSEPSTAENGGADTIPHERVISGIMVKGKVIDDQTRCSHYHTRLDIIAIKFKCCDTYYPCYSCHAETTDHHALTWEISERDEKAILCGVCGHELTINEYMNSDNTCTRCKSSFNPNCKKHYDLYFTMN